MRSFRLALKEDGDSKELQLRNIYTRIWVDLAFRAARTSACYRMAANSGLS
jgi:hypothetical protein